MRERPILFSAPMVRAILEGRKSQTRRIAKPGRTPILLDGSWSDSYVLDPGNTDWLMRDCRYGKQGDKLWVREPWRTTTDLNPLSGSEIATLCLDAGYKKPWAPIQYEADSHRVNWEHTSTPPHNGPPQPGRYRPAMFMPRWASRILLDVTAVRVERLHQISKADAMAEGIVEVFDGYGLQDGSYYDGADPIESYAALWESINGAGSWNANPWVWVISFRMIEINHDPK